MYHITTQIKSDFDSAVEKVTGELNAEGFGVLTDIDVKETIKKKLDKDFRKYRILGACNPPYAYRALSAEDKIGVFLPCNVIVQEIGEGKIEISAVDPMAAMASVENRDLEELAMEIKGKLQKVIDRLK
jgi:uncharacterized protein (DUF302 family)